MCVTQVHCLSGDTLVRWHLRLVELLVALRLLLLVVFLV